MYDKSTDWLREIDLDSSTLSYHLSHSEISTTAYIRAQNIALGADVLQKKRVYLDQKYWIHCRDAARNFSKPIYKHLYETLQKGVKEGQLLCPASHLILEETLKQTDSATRDLTAHIIQELSDGVTIQPIDVLDQAEILHFLMTTRSWKVEAYPIEQLAWTCIGNVFGHLSPVNEMFDSETNQAMQKEWFDLMSKITFPTLVKALASMPDRLLHTEDEFYKRQNEQCEAHKEDFRSFKQIFLIEIGGALDTYRETLRESTLYMYEEQAGNSRQNVSKYESEDIVQQLVNLIYQLFRLSKINKQLSGIRIMAGIHAAVRYKRQKYKRGDQHDHSHARVALPYCNLFLTEKNLCHLLTTKPLEYDQLYGCRVVWEPDEAVAAVEELMNGGAA